MLGIDFTYPILQKTKGDTSSPEIQLMSLIVVATKLSQPFDDTVRHPEDDSDPTTVKIDWKKWQEVMIEKPQDGLKRGEEIHVEDTDVPAMSEKQMDDYLDWYQRTWVDGNEPKSRLLYCSIVTLVLTSYSAA
jgi:RNA polymerase I-specific transcription initiation factor RRN7